mgnify:CR=1 FL=1
MEQQTEPVFSTNAFAVISRSMVRCIILRGHNLRRLWEMKHGLRAKDRERLPDRS